MLTSSATYGVNNTNYCYAGSPDCSSTSGGGGTPGSYTVSYAGDIALCFQSFDNFQGLGAPALPAAEFWYTQGDPSNQTRSMLYGGMGGNYALLLTASRFARYYAIRSAGSTAIQLNINTLNDKTWVEPAQ